MTPDGSAGGPVTAGLVPGGGAADADPGLSSAATLREMYASTRIAPIGGSCTRNQSPSIALSVSTVPAVTCATTGALSFGSERTFARAAVTFTTPAS